MLSTGTTSCGASGDISIGTGTASTGDGGDISIVVGDGNVLDGGHIYMYAGKSNAPESAGDVKAHATGGSISLISGYGTKSTSGSIIIRTLNAGTNGVSGELMVKVLVQHQVVHLVLYQLVLVQRKHLVGI